MGLSEKRKTFQVASKNDRCRPILAVFPIHFGLAVKHQSIAADMEFLYNDEMGKMFETYRHSIIVGGRPLKSNRIVVGEFSYYSGYYHGHAFEDCVLYMDERDNQTVGECADRLIIGKFCAIGSGVKFMMGGNHGHRHDWITAFPMEMLSENFDNYMASSPPGFLPKGDTVIGNDVWIGTEALILPGKHVADGAVIAARAVVTKDIGPYEIWGGNPARLITKRFSEGDIEKLLQIGWWDWDIEKIMANVESLRSNEVAGLWKLAME
jgi:chloramphenicol O-acetyltransferase type B